MQGVQDTGSREGTVIKAGAVHHILVRDEDGVVYRCKTRGKLRSRRGGRGGRSMSGQRANDAADRTSPVVGDVVRFHAEPSRGPIAPKRPRGVIDEITPRRNQLVRRSVTGRTTDVVAVNVDVVVIVVAIADPPYKKGLIDRYLVACETEGLEAIICVNKADLLRDDEDREALAADLEIYPTLEYPVVLTSAETEDGEGLDHLRSLIAERVSVFTGPSGVGKSSLLNALEPDLALATADVSHRTGKGRHTTTGAVLVPIGDGGYVVDTPGLRSFGLDHVDAREVRTGFRDLAAVADGCRFSDCRHLSEPDCAVKAAVDAEEIDAERYDSYIRLLESLDEGSLPPVDADPEDAPGEMLELAELEAELRAPPAREPADDEDDDPDGPAGDDGEGR